MNQRRRVLHILLLTPPLAGIGLLAGCASPTSTPVPASPTPAPSETPTPPATPTPTAQPTPAPSNTPAISPTPTTTSGEIFERNRRLGRGVNLGNALEAPNEGDWGVTLEETDFQLIHAAGFNSVRVPIRWSAHAAESTPYTIDPAFFARIDWVIEQAFANELAVVITCTTTTSSILPPTNIVHA
jgi:endoglucanase